MSDDTPAVLKCDICKGRITPRNHMTIHYMRNEEMTKNQMLCPDCTREIDSLLWRLKK